MSKKKTNKKQKMYTHLIVDRSGSMSSCQQTTIDSINEYMNAFVKDKQKGRYSITLFDTNHFGDNKIDHIVVNQKIKDFKEITTEDYQPRGMTPLYDAIGQTFNYINSDIKMKDDVVKTLVIITDGMENTSREFNQESVKRLLKDKQSKDGGDWLVVYLGANQDAFAVGGAMGVSTDYSASFNTANIQGATHVLSSKISSYIKTPTDKLYGRGIAKSKNAYTTNERNKSM